MRIRFVLFCLFFITTCGVKAQSYVTIPDANFVSWLQAHYPSCMSGNLMDTTCTGITTATYVFVAGEAIADLTGIQYFDNLLGLECSANPLAALPPFPATLTGLSCSATLITNLPPFPNTLVSLSCSNNANLLTLPTLPNSLTEISCTGNPFISFPALPNSLLFFDCSADSLISLPALPASLLELYCYNNKLTSLPALPNSLTRMLCSNNQLTALPALPPNLGSLECNYNFLTSLPSLPSTDSILQCRNNFLTALPALPNVLRELNCKHNNISCFPVFPLSLTDSSWVGFNIAENPFTCLPNYVAGMNVATLAYPLCVGGDVINNPYSCGEAKGIIGNTYKDVNTNCSLDVADQSFTNVHLKLYDSGSNLIAQTYSFANGLYNFSDTIGTYTVVVDTAGVPFTVQCAPGIDTLVVFSASVPLADSVNFDIACKSSFDIGVQSTYVEGWVFPNEKHRLSVVAGDLSSWYGLNCAAGVSGTVTITVSGPIAFYAIGAGALTPSIAGNVYTYTIPDFGSIDMLHAFDLEFLTDITAQIGNQVCVNITVTPVSGDNQPSNNAYYFCYNVVNSHDPNMKEVYPVNVLPNYQDWFTYTIHFQNTGNAPAMNIRLTDTLDANMDLETFQVINYSHYNTVLLEDNALAFCFPGIMLADSTSDPEGSKGFVQYRIKPKAGLPDGTILHNTAYIYFDFNAPVITNTTLNQFMANLSVAENLAPFTLNVFPNPSNGKFFIDVKEKSSKALDVEVYNLLGTLIYKKNLAPGIRMIDFSEHANGVYLVKVSDGTKSISQRIVKN